MVYLNTDMLKNAAERLPAVILNIVMPRADGIQVLRIMGQMGVLDQLPVFLITGEHKDEVLREAYGAWSHGHYPLNL